MKRCEKHPKFKGTKIPKTECACCLALYFRVKRSAPRMPIKVTKVIKSKKIYTRKNKHTKPLS